MPRGDRTGPLGQGSGTGRGAGYCSGADAPGFASAPGRGGWTGRMGGKMGGRMGGRGGRGGVWCRGMGGGYRFAPWQNVPADATGERQALLAQAKAMQANLDAINDRLSRLEQTENPE